MLIYNVQIKKVWTKKNPHQINDEDSLINKAATYSPRKTQVPSAMGDLTSLFGMGRGEHPRQNHLKTVILSVSKTN
jgi:hypothetical protein